MPIRRGVYVRAYISLLQDALQAAAVDNRVPAEEVLKDLKELRRVINGRPQPVSEDQEFLTLIIIAHDLLGFKGSPFAGQPVESASCAQ